MSFRRTFLLSMLELLSFGKWPRRKAEPITYSKRWLPRPVRVTRKVTLFQTILLMLASSAITASYFMGGWILCGFISVGLFSAGCFYYAFVEANKGDFV